MSDYAPSLKKYQGKYHLLQKAGQNREDVLLIYTAQLECTNKHRIKYVDPIGGFPTVYIIGVLLINLTIGHFILH